MIPLHATLPIGAPIDPAYFSPGVSLMNGKVHCSLWAISYWRGQSFRYERAGLGEVWVRVENLP